MTRTDATPLRPGDRVGLIAGNGSLPLDVARSLSKAGFAPFVIIVDGETGLRPELREFPHAVMPVEDFALYVPRFRQEGVTHVVMAGGVTRRPKLSAVKWNLQLLKVLGRAVVALARGDDGLLKAIVGYVEANGMKIVGPHEVVPDLLAVEGCLTLRRPSAADQRDLDAAYAAARAIGELDIGQGAVAIGGRAIALEGIEGTDGLLERVGAMRDHGRLAGKPGGVIVKCAKPGQELRADLPAIGVATVEGAHAAGLAGIGVEAERTFVLDQASAVQRANELGLFIVGLPRKPEP